MRFVIKQTKERGATEFGTRCSAASFASAEYTQQVQSISSAIAESIHR
jgi:hypothetical protein